MVMNWMFIVPYVVGMSVIGASFAMLAIWLFGLLMHKLFSRVEVVDRYVVNLVCPDCGLRWHKVDEKDGVH